MLPYRSGQVSFFTEAFKEQMKIDEPFVGAPPTQNAIHPFVIQRFLEVSIGISNSLSKCRIIIESAKVGLKTSFL